MDMEKMGKFISKLRKEKGLTQKELANQLHITDRAVSKWERGLSCPDISLLEPLANILGVSLSSLLNGEKSKSMSDETILHTISYVKESKKAKRKEYINYILKTSMVLLTILVLGMFLIVEYRFLKKYPTRNVNVTITDLYIEDDPIRNYDYFDAVSTKAQQILNEQGIFSDEEYASIKNYVKDISKDVVKDKEIYQKKALSYKEIYEYADLNHENSLLKIDSRNYKPSIYQIVQKYDQEISLENIKTDTYESMQTSLRDYVVRTFDITSNSKYIGVKAMYMLYEKYDYYDQILTLLMKEGKIE